ncbi:MAG: nuclear transport factor 2 family protein [Pseudomonadota bacterium]
MDKEKKRETLVRFSDAWRRRDVEGVLACFAPNAVYSASVGPAPGREARGAAEIAALIGRMFEHDDGAVIHISDMEVTQARASWKWRYDLPDGSTEFGCDFFTFSGGRILLKDAYRKIKMENDR